MITEDSKKLNILVAYPYMKQKVIDLLDEHKDEVRFLLDSGAFTAWKAKTEIKVEDYCDFIESLPFKPWRYFTLDKIGDPEGTMENYEYMLSRGLNPIPIFTRGEDISMIDKFYETSDVIAIGGLVGTRGNKGFVKGVMEIIGDRKVHWLGFTNSSFVNFFKPYMCDCSSWSYATRYGDLQLYVGKGKIKAIHRREFYKRPPKLIVDTVKSYGFDPKLLGMNESWRSPSNIVHELVAQSWIRRSLEAYVKLDTHLFLAAASREDINVLLKGYRKELANMP